MRKAVVFIVFVVALAAFALGPSEGVAATKLTSQQVENVCGKNLKTEASGVSGCFKECGLNKEHSCQFGCYKGGCWGNCDTCGQKRSAIFPNLYSSRVVRSALRSSP